MDDTNQPPVITETKPAPPPKAAKKTNKNLPLILLVVLLLIAGAGAYYWRDKGAKEQDRKSQAEIAALKDKVATLERAAAEEDGVADAVDTAPEVPTADVKENIIASIKSGNTAALEGYMAPTVRVIIAASEGVGDRTPMQAIGDLEYLDSATDPWDFALPAAELAAWRSGSYGPYFPTNAVVGRSADSKVVSFTFNSSGKISGIFMSANDDLL